MAMVVAMAMEAVVVSLLTPATIRLAIVTPAPRKSLRVPRRSGAASSDQAVGFNPQSPRWPILRAYPL